VDVEKGVLFEVVEVADDDTGSEEDDGVINCGVDTSDEVEGTVGISDILMNEDNAVYDEKGVA
jgi:hypothetical protein